MALQSLLGLVGKSQLIQPFTDQCIIPHNSSSEEICRYLKDNVQICNDFTNLSLKYYYCSNVNNPILSNIILWLIIFISIGLLFIILGLLASDYLVPNMSALSDFLNMDEKLSGLTLLAFANGSPDILSTYIAMNKGMTTMAIGELLGSANFALTVVIGVMAIYKPFKVNQITFTRDLIIFSSLLIISLIILFDGTISIFESIILCCLYILFIILNIFLPNHEKYEKLESSDEDITIDEQNINNNSLTQVNLSTLPNDEIIRNNNRLSVISMNNDDNLDRLSTTSSDSNASMNDYYFAHNVDNLDQGNGYKIALMDSLKLAWLCKRKTSRIVPPYDIEQQNNEVIPLNSNQSSQSLQYIVRDDDEEEEEEDDDENDDTINNDITNSTITINTVPNIKTTHTGDSEIENANRNTNTNTNTDTNNIDPPGKLAYKNKSHSSTPILSRLNSKKSKDKNDYQILFPSRQNSSIKRFGSSLKLNTNLPLYSQRSTPQAPVDNVTPFKGNFQIIDEEESEVHREIPNDSPIDPMSSNVNTLSIPENTVNEDSINSINSIIPYIEYQKTENMFAKIFPIHIFRLSTSFGEKLLSIIIIPFSTIFNIIIPQPLPLELNEEIYKHELSISTKLFHLQSSILVLLMSDFEINLIIILLMILFPTMSIVFQKLSVKYYNLVFPPISAIFGFLTVLKLITLTASIIILLLKYLAIIYSINESILGLTILSIGNSIGDVVTNLALAGLGRPLTGLHACFGSPLLYILFGVGVCSLIIQLSQSKNTIEFTVDSSLIITSISIISMLIMYSIILPINGWTFKRWMGVIGVAVWFIVTSFNAIINGVN